MPRNLFLRKVPRSDGDVVFVERAQYRLSKRWIVLAIRVYCQNGPAIGLQRRLESLAQCFALPAVFREFNRAVANKTKQRPGSIARPVVDSYDSRVRQCLAQTFNDSANRRLGVERRKHDDHGLDHSSSASPSIAARIALRSASIDSTVCASSAARAALRSSPLFRYSSI